MKTTTEIYNRPTARSVADAIAEAVAEERAACAQIAKLWRKKCEEIPYSGYATALGILIEIESRGK